MSSPIKKGKNSQGALPKKKRDHSAQSELEKPSTSTSQAKESTKTPESKSSTEIDEEQKHEYFSFDFQSYQLELSNKRLDEMKELPFTRYRTLSENNYRDAAAKMQGEQYYKELQNLPSIAKRFQQVVADAQEKLLVCEIMEEDLKKTAETVEIHAKTVEMIEDKKKIEGEKERNAHRLNKLKAELELVTKSCDKTRIKIAAADQRVARVTKNLERLRLINKKKQETIAAKQRADEAMDKKYSDLAAESQRL